MKQLIVAALVTIGFAVAVDGVAAEAHWHDGNDHGNYAGQQLTAEECEALFGGDGWE